MNINIKQLDNNSNAFAINPSEAAPLEQLMSSKATTIGNLADGDGPSDVERELRLYVDFASKVFDGSVRSKEEISLLLKEMALASGISNHKLIEVKLSTVQYAIALIDGESGKGDASLREALLAEFKSLLNLKKFQTKFFEKRMNPTIWNGGLDPFGNNPKEWAKELF